jgi:hypothetical protein
MEISRTIPSNVFSRLLFLLNVSCAAAELIGNAIEVSHSSEIQPGSFVEAELGGLSKTALVVTHGVVPAQDTLVVAVHPLGRFGAVTPSKFSEH